MRKRWVSIGIGLILIGIGGAAFYKFNFGEQPASYRQQWTFDASELRTLSIEGDTSAFEIRFVPSTDGANSIEMDGAAEPEIADRIGEARIHDGTLDLNLADQSHRFFNLNIGKLKVKQTVTVKLTAEAAQTLSRLKLSSDVGTIRVSGAQTQTAEISTDVGSIQIDDYQGETLKLSSDVGKIKASDIRAALEASTDFGSIEIERSTGPLKVTADAGSINVQHLSGTANLSTDSGSIRLLKDDTSSAELKTDSGSVRVQLPADFGGTYDLKSDTGSIHAPDAQGTTGDIVKVRTDSGSIRVTTDAE